MRVSCRVIQIIVGQSAYSDAFGTKYQLFVPLGAIVVGRISLADIRDDHVASGAGLGM
jgi:hypothetical protein